MRQKRTAQQSLFDPEPVHHPVADACQSSSEMSPSLQNRDVPLRVGRLGCRFSVREDPGDRIRVLNQRRPPPA